MFIAQGAVIMLSSPEEDSSGAPGGTAILINSSFQGGRAEQASGGVAYLDEFAVLNITGDLNR